MADNSENPDDNGVEINGDDAVIEGVSAHYEFGADDVMPAGGDKAPAVAEDVLPDTLVLLPLPGRPFFPGQVQPIGLNPDQWQETLQAIAEHKG
jgi:ATP-dependent Lon protease